jgi:release factor glutamine methyltransferase
MKWTNNRLLDLRKIYLDELKIQFGENEALQMLNMLILHFFGLSRSQLAINSDFRLSESEMLSLHNAVKELKTNKPVQYVIGEAEFYGMPFFVNESALIPRPETEELVDLIVKNEKQSGLKVLDIGTGSGCIAISLANTLFEPEVFAMDISVDALKLAIKNSEINGTEIVFFNEDILNPGKNADVKFDVIVSNPPYVTVSEKKLMQPNVLDFEPHLALFVEDNNPLIFYNAIVEFAKIQLKNKGKLYLEINEKLGQQTSELLKKNSFYNIKIIPDINGKNRIISAEFNS